MTSVSQSVPVSPVTGQPVATVSVRQLRNNGRAVLDQVARGEVVVVTRDGAEVAELRSRPRRGASAAELVARRRALPRVDPQRLRREVDSVLDQTL